MDIGIIGLGRMGGNMARRLARGGVRVVAFDHNERARAALRDVAGVTPAGSPAELVDKLPAPRVIWTMLPAGQPSADTFAALAPLMARADVVVDGANAYYRDSMQHAATLATRGIEFV